MTELGFLIELLTEHKLPKATKQRITERMKEVESGLSRAYPHNPGVAIPRAVVLPPGMAPQAASTLAAMARQSMEDHASGKVPPINLDRGYGLDADGRAIVPEEQPVTQIAQTPAAAMALQQRAQMINDAVSGQVAVKEPGKMTTKGARKW